MIGLIAFILSCLLVVAIYKSEQDAKRTRRKFASMQPRRSYLLIDKVSETVVEQRVATDEDIERIIGFKDHRTEHFPNGDTLYSVDLDERFREEVLVRKQ